MIPVKIHEDHDDHFFGSFKFGNRGSCGSSKKRNP